MIFPIKKQRFRHLGPTTIRGLVQELQCLEVGWQITSDHPTVEQKPREKPWENAMFLRFSSKRNDDLDDDLMI